MHSGNRNLRIVGVDQMKRILPLIAIEVLVWVILLGVTFVIARGAFQINLGTASLLQRIVTQVARVSISAGLVLVWLLSWKELADHYLSRTLYRES